MKQLSFSVNRLNVSSINAYPTIRTFPGTFEMHPLFKKRDKNNVDNRKLLKILETIIENKLSSYFEENKLVNSHQFGFTKTSL